MAMVELKGLHIVQVKGRQYVYAWRGGPRINARPGTPAFMAAYNEAIEARRTPDTSRFRAVITRYRASPDFQKLAPTTRAYGLAGSIGSPPTSAISASSSSTGPEKIRPLIRKWRAGFAHQPRTADYAMQVLSRAVLCGRPAGQIASQSVRGHQDALRQRSLEIIWTDDDIAALRKVASAEVMWAVDLAAATGFVPPICSASPGRMSAEDAIVITTSKSRFRREAVIPLYDELRELLQAIPKRSTIILTNSTKGPGPASTAPTGPAV
jgi:hypothetical protein